MAVSGSVVITGIRSCLPNALSSGTICAVFDSPKTVASGIGSREKLMPMAWERLTSLTPFAKLLGSGEYGVGSGELGIGSWGNNHLIVSPTPHSPLPQWH